jgi:hypothetical protein
MPSGHRGDNRSTRNFDRIVTSARVHSGIESRMGMAEPRGHADRALSGAKRTCLDFDLPWCSGHAPLQAPSRPWHSRNFDRIVTSARVHSGIESRMRMAEPRGQAERALSGTKRTCLDFDMPWCSGHAPLQAPSHPCSSGSPDRILTIARVSRPSPIETEAGRGARARRARAESRRAILPRFRPALVFWPCTPPGTISPL